ncbi:pentatricopeptide repeat-containing protein At5g39680 isoform X2 [Hevea brasiliensis]|uniref:pentatricopeptide repeat-containing protein At5g39680 isoform X2 n=1 Tax=Hevea brasiliensis TaxID=3981 RepID=UPI0025FDEE25|nr:pentatricopeptide repeat-containing protein At5g39680 isoform X2 [Hevea brasiliensis]
MLNPRKTHASLRYGPYLFKHNQSPSAPPPHPIKLLKLSADTKNLKFGKLIHAYLIITNRTTKNNALETNSLINFYAKCNELFTARKLFDGMRQRNLVSWSALMTGYLHNGFSFEVIRLLKDMVSGDAVSPNEYIFAIALASCSHSRRVEEGQQCHCYILKSGLVFHQYVRNALLHMYSKCFSFQEVMWIWNLVPGNDVFAYNSVLSGVLENGYLKEGFEVLRRMVSDRVKWDTVTYVNVFGLCACLKDLRLGLQVHGKMLMSDVECDAYVSSAMINMYGKCREALNARRVFDGLRSQNVVLWTAIIAAYFQNGCFEEALNFFSKMKLDGARPNEFTFAVTLNATAGLSAIRLGHLLHACTEKSGFKDYVTVGNALINMYAKSGNIQAANKVFSDMTLRDTITWNAMICGYSHHGLGVLSACCHLGLVQEGFCYLNQMKESNIVPGLEHYTCIVGLLSKAGRLDDAQNFMRSMPVKWDVVAWRTLINACHIHRNYGLGKRIAEWVLEMDPNDVGTYMLLSNMYAKAKRWDGVVKIRKLMRDKNLKKEPGVSWIEIRNVAHVFVSEDTKHPEHNEIYEKVKELLTMIKPLGYVPDTGAVLHDVEDEQKDHYLSYHSEKLAIAYGLMKTPSKAPIIVIKNLRMCDDCHLAVKLISKVANRMIIVRDTNRFHHFQEGYCSCADYW